MDKVIKLFHLLLQFNVFILTGVENLVIIYIFPKEKNVKSYAVNLCLVNKYLLFSNI